MRKKIPHVKAGDPITADLLNAIIDRIEPFSKLSVAGPFLSMLEGPHGKTLNLALPRPMWARLSGSGNPYSWQMVRWDDTAGAWVDHDAVNSSGDNAYELNGATGLGGKIAELKWTTAGDYRFQARRYGCPGGGKVFTLTHTSGCAAVGATVDFLVGGVIVFSGATDASGNIRFPGASSSQTYTINWSFEGLSGSVVSVGCLGAVANSAVPAGYTQNCVYPTPTLYITDTAGTREIWPNPACVNFDYPSPGSARQWKSQLEAIGTCSGPTWRVTTRRYGTLPGPCDPSQIQGTDTATFSMSCTSPMSYSGVTTGTAWGGSDKAFMIHE